MRRAISCLPLALLFLVNVLPSHAQTAADTAAGAEPPRVQEVPEVTVYFEVRGNLSLTCDGLAAAPADIVWKVNGTNLEQSEALKDRFELSKDRDVFSVKGRTREEDFGNYSCGAGAGAGTWRAWRVAARAHAKLPANTNVVEGQKLKLQCRLVGRPYPSVAWTYSNVTDAANGSMEVTLALGSRATLRVSEQGVVNGELIIDVAERSDAGWYTCAPAGAGSQPATTTLRVKDMYAALWPFLGICAEVFVLCAVILLYERRRTKPELDDSDTDNHDQKKS